MRAAKAVRISADNVVGLVVGEGCFYAESAPDPKYRSGWRVRPGFSVELRVDDLPVLEEVRRHLACGEIYHLDFGRYKGYEARSWAPHAKFRVSRIHDLHQRVVPFFSENPLFGKKADSFEVFAELVDHLVARRHRSPDGALKAAELAARLSATNGRRRAG